MGIRDRVTQESALTALVAVGLLLRVWQYAANPPLRGASMQRVPRCSTGRLTRARLRRAHFRHASRRSPLWGTPTRVTIRDRLRGHDAVTQHHTIDERIEDVGFERFREHVPLREVAAEREEFVALLDGLDTFRNGAEM